MRWGDDCTFAEDGRRANPKSRPQETANGDLFWSLRVHLYASQRWPVDGEAWLFVRQRKSDGVITIDAGRYFPPATEDDGA